MSHFPAGQPYSSVAVAGANVSQALPMSFGNASFASYSATLNFGVGATDPYLLFTTEANRGRFFPTKIAIMAAVGSFNGGIASTPVVRIGWFARSNPYDNWVSLKTVQSILDNNFGAEQYNDMDLETWEAFLSAPPSTGIYIDLAPSTTTNDVRIVNVFGIYTG
jgi:hypothetical protein